MADLGRDALIAELRALRSLLERDGVSGLSLIGSRARRDNRADSDVDLLVDLDDTRPVSMLDVVGFGHHVQDRLGLTANIFLRRSLDPHFLSTTARDAVRIF
jgi:predicted nucleotidyltransferase